MGLGSAGSGVTGRGSAGAYRIALVGMDKEPQAGVGSAGEGAEVQITAGKDGTI